MKKFFVTILFISIVKFLFAVIPAGYYNNATGSGYTLKTQLYNIIKTGHTAQGYGDLYDAYVEGDTDPEDGYVWDMYSENPGGTDPYNYEHYTNNCGSYSSEGDCLNREHLFPQGIFGSASPMKSDYHHVVPSDGKVNGQRSSYPFGEVGSASWTSLNGSKRGTCNYPGYTGTVFEPIDEFKGDIARCMLYFATRYETQVASWSHTMLNGTSDQVYADWFISMLVEWHIQDPVDTKDNMRNEAGYDFQGNRNPFIDHPEYVNQIWGGGGNMIPSISNITINPEYPTSSDYVSISAEITDHNGSIESAELHWGISSGSLSNTITLTNSSGNTYTTNTSIPAQDDETTIYFEIEATDDEPETNTTSEQSYNIDDNPTFNIFYEDFETVTVNQVVDINGWTDYKDAGTKSWEGREHNSNKYAQMSAYNTSEASNITWLMTPEIDLSVISEATLTFISKDAYNDGDPIELFITTNYSGNPTTTTWTKLNAIFATGTTSGYADNFTESGSVDLTSHCENTIYLGYKYIGGDPSLTTTMQIDDILITGKNSASGNNLPTISDIVINPENPTATENVSISATIIDPDGSILSADLKWGTSSGSYPNTISMTNSGNDYSGEIPMQSYGAKVYFIIDASDNEAENKQTSEYEYIVNDFPVISDVDFNPTIPVSTENTSVSATITDSDGTISMGNIKWGTSTGSYPNTVSMSNSGDDYSAEIPMQTNGTTIYFIIQARDNEAGNKQSSEHSYTVNYLPAISNISLSPENPTDKDIITVSSIITDSDGSISSANLKWGTESDSYTNTVSMSSSGNTYSGKIPVQLAGTTIYFLIDATDNLSEQKEFSSTYSVIGSTGIIELTDNNLKIYPNPVKDYLNIELSNGEKIKTIELFNIVGEKVLEMSSINSSEFILSIGTFSKGIYFIKIDVGNSSSVKRIILE
jgi:endonuclease I